MQLYQHPVHLTSSCSVPLFFCRLALLLAILAHFLCTPSCLLPRHPDPSNSSTPPISSASLSVCTDLSCLRKVWIYRSRTALTPGTVRSILTKTWWRITVTEAKWLQAIISLKQLEFGTETETKQQKPTQAESGVGVVIQNQSALWQHLINCRLNIPVRAIISIQPHKNDNP